MLFVRLDKAYLNGALGGSRCDFLDGTCPDWHFRGGCRKGLLGWFPLGERCHRFSRQTRQTRQESGLLPRVCQLHLRHASLPLSVQQHHNTYTFPARAQFFHDLFAFLC